MALYRYVYTSFWEDAKVQEEMTPEDKLFYLYLLTNPCTTMTGIYSITKKRMAFDLGYSIETVNSLVDRFENYHKMIKYNEETREIALLNWGKYNLNKGGKPVEDCIKRDLQGVKDKKLVSLVGERVQNEKLKSLYLACLESFDDTSHDTSTIRERYVDKTKTKTKTKTKKTNVETLENRKKEILSSLEDVKAFVSSLSLRDDSTLDPDLLVEYFDLIRLTRSTGRVSVNVLTRLIDKWSKYSPVVVEYAIRIHLLNHDDKRENYTIGIMRHTKEEEAVQKLSALKAKGGVKNAGNYGDFGGSETDGIDEEPYDGYYDQFPGLFAN